MPESSDLSLMTDRVGKGWFSMLCHGSELIGSGISPFKKTLAGLRPTCGQRNRLPQGRRMKVFTPVRRNLKPV
jgi:hypothetical protein